MAFCKYKFNYTQISVYDLMGKKVFSTNEKISIINLLDQQQGIYMLEIRNGSEKRIFTLKVY